MACDKRPDQDYREFAQSPRANWLSLYAIVHAAGPRHDSCTAKVREGDHSCCMQYTEILKHKGILLTYTVPPICLWVMIDILVTSHLPYMYTGWTMTFIALTL